MEQLIRQLEELERNLMLLSPEIMGICFKLYIDGSGVVYMEFKSTNRNEEKLFDFESLDELKTVLPILIKLAEEFTLREIALVGKSLADLGRSSYSTKMEQL